jgi:hypothetical protein
LKGSDWLTNWIRDFVVALPTVRHFPFKDLTGIGQPNWPEELIVDGLRLDVLNMHDARFTAAPLAYDLVSNMLEIFDDGVVFMPKLNLVDKDCGDSIWSVNSFPSWAGQQLKIVSCVHMGPSVCFPITYAYYASMSKHLPILIKKAYN